MQRVPALYVMIASPSDIPEARTRVYESIQSWNETYTASRNYVLLPLRWETSAVPEYGRPAQEILNEQLLSKADIVVALFGHRLGQATAAAVSGTAEEITRAHEGGKPVHVYFSEMALPSDVDTKQLDALRQFKDRLSGLYGTFNSLEQLNMLIWTAIEADLLMLEKSLDSDDGAPIGEGQASRVAVRFTAQPGSEQRQKTDSRGRVSYETRRWVDITNTGSEDAVDVRVAPDPGGHFFIGREEATVIHAGQTRRFPMMLTLASSDPVIKITWREDGEEKESSFHVG